MNVLSKRIWNLAVELTMNGSSMAALAERGDLTPERLHKLATEMCERSAALLAIAVMSPAFGAEVRSRQSDTGVPNP